MWPAGKSSEENITELDLIFDAPDCRGPIIAEDSPQALDPVGQVIEGIQMEKGAGPDASWDEPIGTRPPVQLSKEFLARSDARVAELAKLVSKISGDHPTEQIQEAITQMRDAVREEVLEEL
jgi:hypothetical protein